MRIANLTKSIMKNCKVGINGSRGRWWATFSIGVQGFSLHEVKTKAEALWFARMLRKAFKKM